MIEYDKADIASSYPALTSAEIAAILDKAYLALIAQKLTGNNPRNIGFEGDNKAIEDVRKLIYTDTVTRDIYAATTALNEVVYGLPPNFLYYIDGAIKASDNLARVDLISHLDAKKFKRTIDNDPWMRNPVCYMENNGIHVLTTTFAPQNNIGDFNVTYVKTPIKFDFENSASVDFELNDSMAEELINLAIIMAQKTVEDSRLGANIQTRPLES